MRVPSIIWLNMNGTTTLTNAFAPSATSAASERSTKPLILNLGCGTKTSVWCVNIDWSPTIRVARNPILKAFAPYFLDAEQMDKVRKLAPVVPHNLRKGIPYPSDSVDAVYHSHVLEHIDRSSVMGFLLEIKRVLKPGGVHRIVVPDLERLVRACMSDFSRESASTDWQLHDLNIKNMIEQMVRRESGAVRKYGPRRRKFDTFIFGDARQRGETHQWMYDRINLAGILKECGFREMTIVDYNTSRIADWPRTNLDLTDDGSAEYRPESIYMECVK